MSNPCSPGLAELPNDFYTAGNANAWSNKAKVGNLKYFSAAVNYLTENQLFTLEDLEAHVAARSNQSKVSKASMKAMPVRKKGLEDLLRYQEETEMLGATNKITALYCRLSQEEERAGESLSIENQEDIFQGGFHHM